MSCGQRYPLRGGKLYFVQPPATHDTLDSLKSRLKRALGGLYYSLGITLVAPIYPFNFRAAVRRHCHPARALYVDIGCGNHRIDPDGPCLDMFDYDAVDIVCDLRSLPFEAESVDAFVSRSVLEHVPRLEEVANQPKRSTLASAGNERVNSYLYLALCLVLWPIKFLDAPSVGRKSFLGMAPTILTTVRKP